jgi:hypothetical protein
LLMCWYNFVYYVHKFLIIFEKNVFKDIGLKLVIAVLPPFMCKGFISVNFNRDGKNT